ncbi:hypothetical protein EDD22DRAFT_982468 [Suillus occidentalis]|nr:hypothetical protein EDD22DRAFT_982468 [Suillus occidentalis]
MAGTHHVNKHGDHEAGGCAWFGNRDNYNLTIKLSEELATPGAGEAGIKLTAGLQKLFYLSIRQAQHSAKERSHTVMNMVLTQYTVHDISGKMPSWEKVWTSIRSRDIPNLHGAYKIGDFWDKISNYEQRGQCGLCRLPESMEHILINCNSLASCTIWKATSCNLATFINKDGKEMMGKSRLFRIIMLESAHLIWKIRCKRVIKNDGITEKHHSATEIYNKWEKALKVKTVLKTWSSVLLNEDNLLDNWVHNSEVLVGMVSDHPPGRNR